MNELAEAHHELDRLQVIISRHEGHMFALRGWLLTVIGGLLLAYYTFDIDMGHTLMWVALVIVALLFFVLESRHANMVEATVERAGKVEEMIAKARTPSAGVAACGWYDGPKVGPACLDGARRWLPSLGMTLRLNLPYYLIIVVIVGMAWWLPAKNRRSPSQAANVQHVR